MIVMLAISGKEDLTEEEMERVCKMANAHNFIKELPEVNQSSFLL